MSTFVVLIHRCRNPAACPGNNSGTCARGYTSNLCGEVKPTGAAQSRLCAVSAGHHSGSSLCTSWRPWPCWSMQMCCAILLCLATQHLPHLGQLLFQCKGPLTSLASRSSGSSLTAPQCVQQTLPTFSCSTYSACGSSAASACGTLLACRHLFKPCSGFIPPRRHGPWAYTASYATRGA
jgi:hypothetical protein